MANVNWLKQARVSVPHRSGFDKSFRNLLSAKVGTLVPVLCDELPPNTRVNLRQALQAQLPPLASDTFMRCKIKLEAFFVPNRLMYGGYEAWLTGDKLYDANASDGPAFVNVFIPTLLIQPGSYAPYKAQTDLLKPGTLADYLGYKFLSSEVSALQIDSTGAIGAYFNLFPFIGYHLIWDSWYRNSKVQNKVFSRDTSGSSVQLYNIPFTFSSAAKYFQLTDSFPDGVKLGDLRQRNFGSDYFTESTPQAQQGSPQTVTVDANDQFSISALRAANSIQQWLERNNLAGFRLQDYVRANYGASLSDGVAQRPLFLGMDEIIVYNKGVEQTAQDNNAPTENPFNSVGSRYGNAYATGNGTLVDDFVTNEPGYLYVIASLVPHVTYSSGILRQNFRYNRQDSQSDLATPLLQNVGNQPIYSKEIVAKNAFLTTYRDYVFGYIDRYADFMTREDELHGILRDEETLQSFALQRSISSNVNISSSFLEIPTDYMDQVTAVTSVLSEYGYWLDIYFDYKVSMPLAEFCQPSLQDPAYEHGKEVTIRRSGSRL